MTDVAREYGQDVAHEKLSAEFTINKPGFVYVYLSNENETVTDVFMDDFNVTLLKSPVINSTEFFPYGLISSTYSRERSLKQDRLYNGKELQDELDLSLFDYGARFYQPDAPAWCQIDPASELMKQYSPYTYSFDNPVRFIDRDGMVPEKVGTDPKPDLKAITSGPKINMDNAPESSARNAAGHPRNSRWFWRKMLEQHPQMFSETNAAEIRAGRAPIADQQWMDFNPSHAAYKSGELIHHHMDQGNMAVGIPKEVHEKFRKDLHHNTGGRSKGGALGKLGMAAGLLGLAFDIFSDDPHALGNQFTAGSKVGKLYYDIGTDQYFEVTERGTEKDSDGNEGEYSVYTTYESYQYNEETKKYEGVNKTGTYRAQRFKTLDEAHQYLMQEDYD